MRCLTRYLLAELLAVFGVVLSGTTVMIMIAAIVQQATLIDGLGPVQILKLVPYILPDALRFAVPGTILFATCSVFGRMSSGNEIIAIKSAGISPMRLLWPAFGLALIVSFAAVWLNDVAVSWGRMGIRKVVIESFEDIAYGMLKSQKSFSTPQFKIVVSQVQGRRLIKPRLTYQDERGDSTVIINADEAELRADPSRGKLTIDLVNVEVEFGRTHFKDPGTYSYQIPLPQTGKSESGLPSPSNMPLRLIPQEAELQEKAIAAQRRLMGLKGAYQLLTGHVEELTGEGWKRDERHLAGSIRRLHRLETEPHRRWANGFSCLCFVVIGAPMAIRLRNADILGSFFAVFLPILVVYYPLLIFGVDQAKSGDLPPYTVWAGNIVLIAWGAWLTRKVLRY